MLAGIIAILLCAMRSIRMLEHAPMLFGSMLILLWLRDTCQGDNAIYLKSHGAVMARMGPSKVPPHGLPNLGPHQKTMLRSIHRFPPPHHPLPQPVHHHPFNSHSLRCVLVMS